MKFYEKETNETVNDELLKINKKKSSKKDRHNHTHRTLINTNTSASFNKSFEQYVNSHKYIPPRPEEEFME